MTFRDSPFSSQTQAADVFLPISRRSIHPLFRLFYVKDES
ncbi:hypothetical protein SD77_1982 [Bacillus badius]|uniref:Ribose 5-phosphate isomerase B n=1 Tax=Bacillus badius TaxID=1455 RepID=A0ABR5AQL4_BACBA|nr:hypothetical protein SD77_1982 [Bacillus badius]